MPSQLWPIRHGETEWTLSGAHTGSTDIPLSDAERCQALNLRESLAGRRFALVLASPLSRPADL
jgi:probable phosphoglycerate mutase